MTLWLENKIPYFSRVHWPVWWLFVLRITILISLAFIGRIDDALDWGSNFPFLSPLLAGLMTLWLKIKLSISLAFIDRIDDALIENQIIHFSRLYWPDW